MSNVQNAVDESLNLRGALGSWADANMAAISQGMVKTLQKVEETQRRALAILQKAQPSIAENLSTLGRLTREKIEDTSFENLGRKNCWSGAVQRRQPAMPW